MHYNNILTVCSLFSGLLFDTSHTVAFVPRLRRTTKSSGHSGAALKRHFQYNQLSSFKETASVNSIHPTTYTKSTRSSGYSSSISAERWDNQQFKLPRLQMRHVKQPNQFNVKSHLDQNERYLAKPSKNSTRNNIYPTLVGHSFHAECHPNSQGHRELPCIIDPIHVSKAEHAKGEMDYIKYWIDQTSTNLNESGLLHLRYKVGEFAYLPCRTLGADQTETTIWEKADSPLFASSASFSSNQRLRLITNNVSKSVKNLNADTRLTQRKQQSSLGKYASIAKTKTSIGTSSHTPRISMTTVSEPLSRRQMWDLVIDFLQPSDADIYTCRLVGRTRQFIRYRVHVTQPKPLVFYSPKKLVQISMPTVARLGYPFNLTCVVQLRKTNTVFVAIDWFRPEHSYDGLFHSISSGPHTNADGLHNTPLGFQPITENQTDVFIRWFSQSFVQLTNRPSLGIRVYKQLLDDSTMLYKSEVVFESAKVSPLDAGFYECRAYEPVNQGDVRVLDRAIIYVKVHRPYPHKQATNGDRPERMGRLLATHWKMLSTDDRRGVHDQYTQNDVAAKNKDHNLPLVEDFNYYVPTGSSSTSLGQWSKNNKRNTGSSNKHQIMMYTSLIFTVTKFNRIFGLFL